MPTPARPGLPTARGPLSEWLIERLRSGSSVPGHLPRSLDDPRTGDDFHLALYCCYELAYRGFDGVEERLEWDPAVLALRARLEDRFEAALREEAEPVEPAVAPCDAIHETIDAATGPSLSTHMLERGTVAQLREFAVHRSAYQLKEADPHSWALPRIAGAAKRALVEIQFDEYGNGVPGQSHAELFADAMRGLDLDATYGAYLDALPGTTLATCNLVSLFGFHRRLRGALVGHLALFEMTSVTPMGRYAAAVHRLGLPAAVATFYDVHVEADAHHEQVAVSGLVGGLVEAEPALAADVVFGARALMAVEGRFASRLLEAWMSGRSSLLEPGRPARPVVRAS